MVFSQITEWSSSSSSCSTEQRCTSGGACDHHIHPTPTRGQSFTGAHGATTQNRSPVLTTALAKRRPSAQQGD